MPLVACRDDALASDAVHLVGPRDGAAVLRSWLAWTATTAVNVGQDVDAFPQVRSAPDGASGEEDGACKAAWEDFVVVLGHLTLSSGRTGNSNLGSLRATIECRGISGSRVVNGESAKSSLVRSARQ